MLKRPKLLNSMTRLILNPQNPSDRAIQGIIFDMDGTLCKPQVSAFFRFKFDVKMVECVITLLTLTLIDLDV